MINGPGPRPCQGVRGAAAPGARRRNPEVLPTVWAVGPRRKVLGRPSGQNFPGSLGYFEARGDRRVPCGGGEVFGRREPRRPQAR